MLRMFVIGMNFLVHCCLLLGTVQVTEENLHWKRCLLSAAIYAGYTGICMVPRLSVLGTFHWRIPVLLLSAGIAFGTGPAGRRSTVLFLLLSMAVDGAAAVMGRDGIFPVLAVGGVLWGLRSIPQASPRTIPVEIEGENGSVQLTALRDTGNSLRDPLTGEAVLVVDGEIAQSLTGFTQSQLASPLDTLSTSGEPGLHLIPFSSVGTERGFLLAKRFSKVRIGRKTGAYLVAFAAHKIGGREFQALTGGME